LKEFNEMMEKNKSIEELIISIFLMIKRIDGIKINNDYTVELFKGLKDNMILQKIVLSIIFILSYFQLSGLWS